MRLVPPMRWPCWTERVRSSGKGCPLWVGMDRVQRLTLSKLPSLDVNFPITSRLILRPFNLLYGSKYALWLSKLSKSYSVCLEFRLARKKANTNCCITFDSLSTTFDVLAFWMKRSADRPFWYRSTALLYRAE